jgi:hypothetical protein
VQGDSPALRVQLAFCVLGSIGLEAEADEVLLLDSVVVPFVSTLPDAVAGTAASLTALRAERSTFLGDVSARTVEASECVFAGRLAAARLQQGCVRYTYVPPHTPSGDSRTPRRFACQPDLAVARVLAAHGDITDPQARSRLVEAEQRRVRAVFVSRRFGDPGFAELDPSCPVEIATGAADGSEMGVYSHVKQAHRLEDLRRRVQEYLPAGITAGTTVIV